MNELAPIDFEPVLLPLIPVPQAIELPPEEGWRMWDAAVRVRDLEQGASQ